MITRLFVSRSATYFKSQRQILMKDSSSPVSRSVWESTRIAMMAH